MAKSNLDLPKDYPACFVCGCHKTGAHSLSIRQSVTPGAYFPFLETHEPPDGAELPSADGKVLSCFACYAFLIQQWESYERNKVPLIKRIYWLKRLDNGPYTGVEMGMQSEYASQVFGLTSEFPSSIETKRPISNINPSKSFSLSTEHGSNMSLESQEKSANVSSFISPSKSVPLTATSDGTQQEALDLSLAKQKRKLNDSETNWPPKVKCKLSQVDKIEQQVLDLSMPDKNAVTEVCYICGNHFAKGTLSNIFAKAVNNFTPFFPSLMLHPRPSGSRPMESSGMVLGCRECFSFLLSQWQTYEEQKVAIHKRSYYLLKKTVDSEKLVCCRCGKLNFANNMKSLFLKEKQLDISHSSDQNGHIQACQSCFKIMEGDSFSSNSFDVSEDNTLSNFKNLPSNLSSVSSRQAMQSCQYVIDVGAICCLCHQNFALKLMQTLSMVPDPENSSNMFFAFLKFLPQISQNMITEDGRILACKACYYHLSLQWSEYERDNVPEDQRHFSLRTLVVSSHSPRLTPGPHHTPPRSSSISSNAPSETSTPPIAATIGVPLGSVEASMDESKRKFNCKIEGYHGQPLNELEVVAATLESNSLTLPSITSQRALNININCYICGFHSKAGQTYAISSKLKGKEMFFPFLGKHVTAHSEAIVDDTTFLICLICFHSLVIQWQHYEKSRIEYHARFYDTYNFTCFICSTRTYRKRLYLLPIKDFPYLKDHICPPGGMVVNNGHSVVVCKDCFVSMKDQFAEAEKWGVPVEKRQYNWIKRPPPPEFPQSSSSVIKSKLENKALGSTQASSSIDSLTSKEHNNCAISFSPMFKDEKISNFRDGSCGASVNRMADENQKLEPSFYSKDKIFVKKGIDETCSEANPLDKVNNLFNYR